MIFRRRHPTIKHGDRVWVSPVGNEFGPSPVVATYSEDIDGNGNHGLDFGGGASSLLNEYWLGDIIHEPDVVRYEGSDEVWVKNRHPFAHIRVKLSPRT